MPSLDLTPAQTTQELQDIIDYCTANIAKYLFKAEAALSQVRPDLQAKVMNNWNDKAKDALKKVKFYEKYLRDAESKLVVTKLLANLKENIHG